MDKSQWISVEDRLPGDGQGLDPIVLMFNANHGGEMDVGYCYRRRQWYKQDGYKAYHVTHWQPLPKGPEVDK